jgi:HSP20 family protein
MPDLKDTRVTPKNQPASQAMPQLTTQAGHSPSLPVPTSHTRNPIMFMKRFFEDMDRLFEDFGQRPGTPSLVGRGREFLRREVGLIPADWSPQVDVSERDGLFVVRADLPGLSKDDIEVEVKGDHLTIRGERKQHKEEDRDGGHYTECSYGRFFRAIPLGEGVDADKATANFQNGVLEVTMPAPPQTASRARRVEIKQGA